MPVAQLTNTRSIKLTTNAEPRRVMGMGDLGLACQALINAFDTAGLQEDHSNRDWT